MGEKGALVVELLPPSYDRPIVGGLIIIVRYAKWKRVHNIYIHVAML